MDDLNSYTYLSEMDFGFSEPINLDPVNIHLLPGENFEQFDLLNYGCRFGLTNYRIIIIYDIVRKDKNDEKCRKSNIISIPLGLIYHIEYYGMVCVNILTKIGCRFSITFPNIELCEETLKEIKKARIRQSYFGTEFYVALKEDFPTHFLISGNYCSNDWMDELPTIENEFQRLQFPSELWRISNVNKDFKVCSSYPQHHIILKDFPDLSVKEMAKFRSKSRFISTVYRSIDTGAVLLRSGQPLTGVSGCRNIFDEEYFSLIAQLTKAENGNSQIVVFDARSYTSAQLNKVKGGGMESETCYPKASFEFLNIPNMHTVKSSLESLSNAMSGDSKNFYDLIDKSTWLLLIRDLLKSASSICNTMHTRGKSVLVHCSDGWDRTPQLTSLTMILMDPFYRTIKGFKVLIQREWIYFGHRFNERCSLWHFETNREFSPIFIQWLDCIHQLQNQFSDHFEFNEKFLIKLALHVHSGLFGTFNKSIPNPDETCSLWNFLCNRDIRAFNNPLYNLNKTFNIMKPVTHMIEMKLWTGLYHNALDPNCHEICSSENLNRDLPLELNNLLMTNSIINDKELDDDYEGEDIECVQKNQIPYINTIDSKSISSNGMGSLKTTKNMGNLYFRSYSLKCSLETIEMMSSPNDAQIWQDIDFDGLYIRRDVWFTFCETNRQTRHLLKRKVEHFKNALHKSTKCLTELTEKRSNIDDDYVFGDGEEDNDSICSDISVLEDVVLWVPDHASTHCKKCNCEFGMLTRKHHCRSCGKIFCKKCSTCRSEVIKQKITWPERVCDNCYFEINGFEVAKPKKNSLLSAIGDLIKLPFHNASTSSVEARP